MHSERQRDPDCGIDHHQVESDAATVPWADLGLDVPNDRSDESIVAFVECILVELTHEDVGAEYVSSSVWGLKRTQFIAVDALGEMFRKRHHGERLGWHEQTISRQDVREELVNRLSRSSSLATNQSHDVPVDDPDTFAVKARHQLQCEMQRM